MMNRKTVMIVMSAATLALTACSSKPQTPEWPRERRVTMNGWMVEHRLDDHVAAGVIAQHTLFPHQFVANSAELNELGERDAAILASHFASHPGSLNVRRGGESDELYEARVATVRAVLEEGGVDLARVTIGDGFAGGDGLVSERVLVILTDKMDEPLSADKAISE